MEQSQKTIGTQLAALRNTITTLNVFPNFHLSGHEHQPCVPTQTHKRTLALQICISTQPNTHTHMHTQIYAGVCAGCTHAGIRVYPR